MTVKVKSSDVAADRIDLLALLGASASSAPPVVPPVVPPIVPPSGLSPDGTTLLASATGSVTTAAGTWTFGSTIGTGGNAILLNGQSASGGEAVSLLIANGGKLYALNTDPDWFLWTSGSWAMLLHGTTPTTTVVPPVAPPVTPPVTPTPPPTGLLPFVRFFGDAGNGPSLSTQARANNFPLTPPFFMTGKFVILDYQNWGALCAWGDQGGFEHIIIFTLNAISPGSVSCYWHGSGEGLLAWAPMPPIGVWCHATLIVGAPDPTTGLLGDFRIILDGIEYPAPPPGTPGFSGPIIGPVPNPFPGSQSTVDVSFGSWGNRAPGGGGDADNLNAGMRDWAIVEGVPTLAELGAYNTDPTTVNAIWPGRVKGFWRFTTIPTPDESGNNRGDLIYSDVGTATGHTLPVLVTT